MEAAAAAAAAASILPGILHRPPPPAPVQAPVPGSILKLRFLSPSPVSPVCRAWKQRPPPDSSKRQGSSSFTACRAHHPQANKDRAPMDEEGGGGGGGGGGGRSLYKQRLLEPPHLRDYMGQALAVRVSPLLQSPYFHTTEGFWLTASDVVAQNVAMDLQDPASRAQAYFPRAGPRYEVVYEPDDVCAAIVTCGGLCPGLNAVVRELVDALWYQYGVKRIHGICGGYRGFYSRDTVPLHPRLVDGWHRIGGSRLGTSRGGFDLAKIVDSVEHRGFNHVYIIGGDGTMRGAVAVFREVERRGLKASVVGIPKTVDNDVGIIDCSFGFQTAVEKAQEAINAGHVEAESTPNGIGLVKLMGRNAGHIAMHASLGSRDVDCCLIPEVPFFLEGPGGLFQFVEDRLKANGHCVIVVAEGAGQELMERVDMANPEKDLSGNLALRDIGLWLEKKLNDWWKSTHPKELFAIKYIDPTYMIRAVPSNAADTEYCTLLAHSALHGAMAGYTGFVAGRINGKFCYIPLPLVAETQHLVDVKNHVWNWLKSVNNQPDFVVSDADKEALESSSPLEACSSSS